MDVEINDANGASACDRFSLWTLIFSSVSKVDPRVHQSIHLAVVLQPREHHWWLRQARPKIGRKIALRAAPRARCSSSTGQRLHHHSGRTCSGQCAFPCPAACCAGPAEAWAECGPRSQQIRAEQQHRMYALDQHATVKCEARGQQQHPSGCAWRESASRVASSARRLTAFPLLLCGCVCVCAASCFLDSTLSAHRRPPARRTFVALFRLDHTRGASHRSLLARPAFPPLLAPASRCLFPLPLIGPPMATTLRMQNQAGTS